MEPALLWTGFYAMVENPTFWLAKLAGFLGVHIILLSALLMALT